MTLHASSHRRYVPALRIIVFEMLDDEGVVQCMVSECALRNRAMVDGVAEGSPEELFDLYRTEVQEIAAEQYDRGLKNPIVRALDLAPPPSLPSR
jgi:uncharacterized protein DUF1488